MCQHGWQRIQKIVINVIETTKEDTISLHGYLQILCHLSHSFAWQLFIEACRQISKTILHIIIIPDEVHIIMLMIGTVIVVFI